MESILNVILGVFCFKVGLGIVRLVTFGRVKSVSSWWRMSLVALGMFVIVAPLYLLAVFF